MSTLKVVGLGREHRTLLKAFRNQHEKLVEYLQRFALRHMEKDLLSHTFLALHQTGEEQRVAGYFTLTTISIEHESVSSMDSLGSLPRFPIPGVLLARLAVDERVQGQGLGRYLMEDVLARVIQLNQAGPVTFRVLVADAKDEPAAAFYVQYGFQPLSEDGSRRMVLDLKALTGTT